MSCAALRLSGGVPDRFASLQGLKAMPAERDGHSLSGQVRVSSAMCFAEGMTCAYREFRPYQPASLWHANTDLVDAFLVGRHIGV